MRASRGMKTPLFGGGQTFEVGLRYVPYDDGRVRRHVDDLLLAPHALVVLQRDVQPDGHEVRRVGVRRPSAVAPVQRNRMPAFVAPAGATTVALYAVRGVTAGALWMRSRRAARRRR